MERSEWLLRGLLEYLEKHGDFPKFVLGWLGIDEENGTVACRADKGNQRLMLIVRKLSQDGGTISVEDFAIKIEKLERVP